MKAGGDVILCYVQFVFMFNKLFYMSSQSNSFFFDLCSSFDATFPFLDFGSDDDLPLQAFLLQMVNLVFLFSRCLGMICLICLVCMIFLNKRTRSSTHFLREVRVVSGSAGVVTSFLAPFLSFFTCMMGWSYVATFVICSMMSSRVVFWPSAMFMLKSSSVVMDYLHLFEINLNGNLIWIS